ncbi:PP2C family protein-serine/threonine phosphatase [Vibrio alginolyticus]
MQTYLFSSKGPRLTNQDAASLTYVNGGVLLCVADGVGGNNGGEVASKLAIEVFLREVISSKSSFGKAVEVAHNEIKERASDDSELSGMATTFTAAFVTSDKVAGIHCGDSRAYILRDNGIKQLSEDHSEVAKLIRSGKLTKETAVDYPRKNVIYSALGSHKELVVDEFEFDLVSQDRIVLVTDGVHGIVSKKTFRDASLNSSSLKEWCDTLITILESLGPEDNFTIASAELD